MSPSPKKAAKEQGEGTKEKARKADAAPSKPTGSVPGAQVVARHGLETVTRPGRGFSLGELEGAGLPAGLARRWAVRVDYRRRSVLEKNVGALKGWSLHRPPAKREGEIQKVEEDLEKVAKEIEKGAKEVEEVAVKAGREVEKEAKKVERRVKKGGKKEKGKGKEKAKPRAKPKK